jgi:hypothetical protein
MIPTSPRYGGSVLNAEQWIVALTFGPSRCCNALVGPQSSSVFLQAHRKAGSARVLSRALSIESFTALAVASVKFVFALRLQGQCDPVEHVSEVCATLVPCGGTAPPFA